MFPKIILASYTGFPVLWENNIDGNVTHINTHLYGYDITYIC